MRLLHLLPLLAMPMLGGCTVIFGLTGGVADRVTAHRAAVVYTLDRPPPLDTPVEVVMRDGRDEAGHWVGIGDAGGARSVVVLNRRDGRPATLGTGDVVEIRSRPRGTHAFLPMLLTGLLIDGFLVSKIISDCLLGCASN